ncbi:30S ribosomal protein S2 [Candidatus Gugararchaeum adminiculabundum]|nr:30S ribosomal protein S2 [Candidatus Gugararchaeum adminiculabundum]
MSDLLIQQEKYLEAGVHIGTKIKCADMIRFIYKEREDRLFVLDLRKIDERIKYAAKVIANYKPEDVAVVASRLYAENAARKFCELTGAKLISGRFVPGMFTNTIRPNFAEPKLVLICDPRGERQAAIEAGQRGVAVIGLCDTDNRTSFIDFVIPCNNKGRKSLALIFYLLARELLKAKGVISDYSDFAAKLEEFEEFKDEPVEGEGAEGEGAAGAEKSEEAADSKQVLEVEKTIEEAKKPSKPRKKKEPAEGEATEAAAKDESASAKAPAEEKPDE